MTYFDVAVIIIILLSTVFAFLRGFIKEFLVLLGWLAAAVITIYLYPQAIELVNEYVKGSKVVSIITVSLLFLTILILISIFNAMILDNLREMRLGVIDRSLGFLFGLLRGVLLASVIHFSIVILHEKGDGPKWLTKGETYNITVIGANMIKDIAEDFDIGKAQEKTEEIMEDTEEALDGAGDKIEEYKEDLEEKTEDAEDGLREYRDNDTYN